MRRPFEPVNSVNLDEYVNRWIAGKKWADLWFSPDVLAGVCLPSDPVTREPLFPGAAGGHGALPDLHPGGQTAASSSGSPDHCGPPEPQRKTERRRERVSLQQDLVCAAGAGCEIRAFFLSFFVCIDLHRLSGQSKTRSERGPSSVTEGLISRFLRLPVPPCSAGTTGLDGRLHFQASLISQRFTESNEKWSAVRTAHHSKCVEALELIVHLDHPV